MKANRKAGAAGRRERRAITAEFKAEAVRWWRTAQLETAANAGMPGESVEQEVRRLRREVAVLRQEQAFAIKVAVYFARVALRYAVITRHRDELRYDSCVGCWRSRPRATARRCNGRRVGMRRR